VTRRPEHFTVREDQVLSQIRCSILDRGEALSMRELGAALGLRIPASVVCHLQNLQRSGARVRDGRNGNTSRPLPTRTVPASP
jgi:hypothetical protein